MNKNRRMKHVVAASLAFGAAALTGFGQIAPAAVYAAEQTETVKTESTKSGEQADEGLFKEETVYVNADANGAVKLITVSDWLKNAGTTESLKDVSELDGIKNIKGEETFSESGDNLTWDTNAAMSNATGLVPDVIGGHGIASDVKSLNETYKLKEDGGILKQHGVVEYVNGIAPGVFVTVATDNEEIAYQMQYHSMGPGPLWTLYRPYHLCNLETPLTAAKVVIDGEPTIVPKNGLVSECITVAKIDLKAGQTIDGIGGYTTYGSICKHEEAKEKGYVPYGLVNHKAVMKRDVKKGELITYDDIELDTTTLIYKLRQEQDKIFG